MLTAAEVTIFAGLLAVFYLGYRLSYAGDAGQRFYLHAIATAFVSAAILIAVVIGKPDGVWLAAAAAYGGVLVAVGVAGWVLLLRALRARR